MNRFIKQCANVIKSQPFLTKSYNKILISNIKFNNSSNTVNKNEINDLDIKKFEAKASSEETQSKTLITNELLCNLIGSKNYQINEEIKLDPYTIVKCFNENDQFLGEKQLKDVFEEAKEINKDVVLRNDKLTPPIVKVMRYKIELMKRLLKKLSKNKDFKLTEAKTDKFISIPYNIDENDLITKVNKCTDLLKHFSHLQIGVFCDLKDKDQVFKANNILNHITDELSLVGKLSQQIKEHKHEISIKTLMKDALTENKDLTKAEKNTKDFQNKLSQTVTDEEVEAIKDTASHTKLDLKIDEEENYIHGKQDKYKDYLFIEVESLLIDTSGIDYEKLLESKNIEDIFEGLKSDSFKGDKKKKEKEATEETILKTEESIIKNAEKKILSYEERLKNIKTSLDNETDFYKKLKLSKDMKILKNDIEKRKQGAFLKAIIHSNFNSLIYQMKKNPEAYL